MVSPFRIDSTVPEVNQILQANEIINTQGSEMFNENELDEHVPLNNNTKRQNHTQLIQLKNMQYTPSKTNDSSS